ncbi:MAG: hypothetical protein AAGA45_05360, partial [Verrucomicrobiota bacterium]
MANNLSMHMASETKGARVAVDAMGGDRGPEEVVAALSLGFTENTWPGLERITLVGDEAALEPLLSQAGLN